MAIGNSGWIGGGRGGNRLNGLTLRMKKRLAYMVVGASIAVEDKSRCHGQSERVFSLLDVKAGNIFVGEIFLGVERGFMTSRPRVAANTSFLQAQRSNKF
jgi:hypothetical protein